MSNTYRLMIYFSVTTMFFYSKDIVCHEKMTPNEFYEKNKKLMDRVFDEGLSIMNYELSHNQIMKACHAFLIAKYGSKSVEKTEVYVYVENQ